MENSDPWLTQDWPWTTHLEIRRRKLSAEQVDALRSIMTGEPLEDYLERKRSRMNIDNDTVRAIAHHIMMTQLDDVEYLSVVEMTDDHFYGMDEYANLSDDERDALYRKVDDLIGLAQVTITFPEEIEHKTEKCKHGTVVSNCRCPGPKAVVIVACPVRCKKKENESNTSDS